MNSQTPQNPEPDLSSSMETKETVHNKKNKEEDSNIISSTEEINSEDLSQDPWNDDLDINSEKEKLKQKEIENENETKIEDGANIYPELNSEDREEEITKTFDDNTKKTELYTARWLDESKSPSSLGENNIPQLNTEVAELIRQKENLQEEISLLEEKKKELILEQTSIIKASLKDTIEEVTKELQEKKNNLNGEIEQLERRRDRIQQEMRQNFAGVSQDLAVRIQGFKEYLVGSLQDLAIAADKVQLTRTPPPNRRSNTQRIDPEEDKSYKRSIQSRTPSSVERRTPPPNRKNEPTPQAQFTEQTFAQQSGRIRRILDQYRTRPDYYGSPWQLRRTFESIHNERVQDWFFNQGGRGAVKGMGSRLQNVLVASAIISVLYNFYRDRFKVLVLVDTPEKLGEWRRGLQDCLGISRADFGSSRGIVLFDSAEVLVQRAERLLEDKLLPLVIIDSGEGSINLSLLKFPLWLAFAESTQPKTSGYY